MNKQNIILILTDQHRFDTVGANGSSVCRTPFLDKLWQGRGGFIAGFYGDEPSIGLEPKWQQIASDEFLIKRRWCCNDNKGPHSFTMPGEGIKRLTNGRPIFILIKKSLDFF